MNDKCTISVNHSNVKVEENKRKAVFKNSSCSLYRVSKIDDCIITDGVRADYLVSKDGVASVVVELKGKNVQHACDQIFASALHEDVKPLLEKRLGFLIVCSKFPRFDTYVLKAKVRAAKEFKAGFHVVCDQGVFDIENVCSISGK
ncbi:hypothetical protein [Rhizobium sp. CSW-27]|uniref:hypothetical protein n=1 Tax=Rhizobium sp. CSW-27 TaxID=2839985 RepID=UPI001C031AA5|nr:hypothetical protein [Rhizobium sp. CSW-27]MBT9373118.1 hypothetical protein [Rhizobium sp. CSW-27]